LVKSPVTNDKDNQRSSSSDSESLQVHFNSDENDKEKTITKDLKHKCIKDYEDTTKKSTGNYCIIVLCKP